MMKEINLGNFSWNDEEIRWARQMSRLMEQSWRIITRPQEYTRLEIVRAGFTVEAAKALLTPLIEQRAGLDKHPFDEIYLGIYYREASADYFHGLKYQDRRN